MKKFTLFLMSMFFMLGTAMAQDPLELTSMRPSSTSPASRVDYILFEFNKDVIITLPAEGIDIRNNETGEVVKITRYNEWVDPNIALLMFEQKIVTDDKGGTNYEDQSIVTPGTYSFTIPAGTITTADGEDFGEQTYTFSVLAPFEITGYTPYGETTVLDKIQLTFSEAVTSVKMPGSGLSVVNDYWSPVANIKNDVIISDDKMSVTLELETPITTPGYYYFDVYNNIFKNETGMGNEYTSLWFCVIDPTPTFSTSFKAGDKVEAINNFEITFKNVQTVGRGENADNFMLFFPDNTGYTNGNIEFANNKITVTFDESLTEEGEYLFYIPEGMFTMDGVPNEAMEIPVLLEIFEIIPLEIESVTPEIGTVGQLERIVIKFNQLVRLSYDKDYLQQLSREMKLTCGDKEYTLTYNSETYWVSSELEFLVNAEYINNQFVTTPITEPGNYELDLSQLIVDSAAEAIVDDWGTHYDWHVYNTTCEGKYGWTIAEDTAIEGIEAEEGEQVIYDLTGRRINKITVPGIYIVNGKKTYVK